MPVFYKLWAKIPSAVVSKVPSGSVILSWDFYWYWPVSCQNIHKRWLPSSWRSHNCNEFSTAELPWNSFQKGLVTWKKKGKFTEPLITSEKQWKFISAEYWWQTGVVNSHLLRGWCQHRHTAVTIKNNHQKPNCEWEQQLPAMAQMGLQGLTLLAHCRMISEQGCEASLPSSKCPLRAFYQNAVKISNAPQLTVLEQAALQLLQFQCQKCCPLTKTRERAPAKTPKTFAFFHKTNWKNVLYDKKLSKKRYTNFCILLAQELSYQRNFKGFSRQGDWPQ